MVLNWIEIYCNIMPDVENAGRNKDIGELQLESEISKLF